MLIFSYVDIFSSSLLFQNVTSETVFSRELYCVMGCNEALNTYFQKLRGKIFTALPDCCWNSSYYFRGDLVSWPSRICKHFQASLRQDWTTWWFPEWEAWVVVTTQVQCGLNRIFTRASLQSFPSRLFNRTHGKSENEKTPSVHLPAAAF